MKYALYFAILVFPLFLHAQALKKPEDFLKADFHKERREALREKMPANSVAVFFANAVRNRSNDVSYVYHQDPNFYYLTGHREPHAVLLIFKDNQSVKKEKFNELIFVRAHDALAELYEGERLGKEGARDQLDIVVSLETPSFEKFNLDFSTFTKVLFYDFDNDEIIITGEGVTS